MYQICKETWLPLLRLSLQKHIVVPVDRLSKMWSGPAFLLFLEYLWSLSFSWSVTLTTKCPRESGYCSAFWRVQWSLMCTDGLRWESASISEA